MKKADNKNWNWKIIAEENGKQVFSNFCPNEAIGDILKIIAIVNKKQFIPDEAIVEMLTKLLEKQIIISKETISNLTGMSEEYITKILSGDIEPAEAKKVIALTEIVARLCIMQ